MLTHRTSGLMFRALFVFMLALALLLLANVAAADNPALWKQKVTDDVATIVTQVR